jgi:23S rRNA-/tRNA-specific pseudouridylate synthase
VISILAEHPDVLVVDKPAGQATIPERTGEAESVVDALRRERGEALWVVHRLDREVSGVLLFARTAEAHRALSIAFEKRGVDKTYEALTEGKADRGATFRWENLLLRGKKRAYVSPHGKSAITEAEVIGVGPLRWRVRPLTGRNHQIRVHLAGAGFPILGDALYGSTTAWASGIALRAVRLSIPAIGDAPARVFEAPGP